MKHLLIILPIVCFSSLIICPAGLGQNDNLIVPGERIGPIYLGMLLDEVVSVLGRPEKMASSPTSSGVFWRWPSRGLGIGFSKNQPAPYVGRVETESARNITSEGVRVGNSTFDVVEALGKPYHTESCCMYYNGLMVEVDNYQIWRISVFSLDYLNNWYYEIEARGQEATMYKIPKYDIQQNIAVIRKGTRMKNFFFCLKEVHCMNSDGKLLPQGGAEMSAGDLLKVPLQLIMHISFRNH